MPKSPRTRLATEVDTDVTAPATDAGMPKGRTYSETYLSTAVLIFGLSLMLLQVMLLLRAKQGWGTNSTRLAGLTLVTVAGLFLITAGYSQNQIAPMFGLLGTIAGYLMGKTEDKGPSGGGKPHAH